MKQDELLESLSIEQHDCERILRLIDELRARFPNDVPDVHALAAFGAYLHSLYGCLENTLKLLARAFDQPLPTGEDWHSRLLESFVVEAQTRPARFIGSDLKLRLDEYRGFRHLFRVHYAVDLEWARLKPLVDSAGATFRAFHDAAARIADTTNRG